MRSIPQTQPKPRPKLSGREAWARYGASLRYALYVSVHPFDGFWDLTHEKRGSLAAANTIVALFLLARVFKIAFTNFQFMSVNWEYVNIFNECMSLLLPLLVFCLANWCWTTLFDGKGTLKDVYMGMAYALAPYVVIQFFMVVLSNLIAYDEVAFYIVFDYISLAWAAFLAFVGMMQIQDYSVGKTIIFAIASIFGMLVIIFLILLFLSLISDGVSYFVSLYREIVFRLY